MGFAGGLRRTVRWSCPAFGRTQSATEGRRPEPAKFRRPTAHVGGRIRESFVDESISRIHSRRKSPLRFPGVRVLPVRQHLCCCCAASVGNPRAPRCDDGQLAQRRNPRRHSVAHDRVRLFCFWRTPGGRYRRGALQRGYSWCVSVVKRCEAVPIRLRAKLSPGRAQMFLGQSHDASANSEERSTEPSVHLLCYSAPHKGMDADNERDTRNISGNHKRNKKRRAQSDAPYRNCVCSATTGQAMGTTCNQQGSQTRSADQCRV